ncbi:MAG: glycerophosphodiester phosphodiesterase family protein [bacterium]
MKRIAVRACFAVFVIALPGVVRGAEPVPTAKPNLGLLKVAHRGAKKFAPENTIPAIEKAIELGFDYVELDVQYTKDGRPVVMHDFALLRTTGNLGVVKLFTLAQITKLDAGSWFGEEFRGVKVPSLEDALKAMKGRIGLYMDQKEPPNEEAVRLLEEYGFLPDNMIVVGSNARQKEFRRLYPKAPVMPNISKLDEMDEVMVELPSPAAFNTHYHNFADVMDELVEAAHARGAMVFVNTMWTGETPEVMRRIIEAGADAIQTDEPVMLNEVLEEMRKEYGEGGGGSG